MSKFKSLLAMVGLGAQAAQDLPPRTPQSVAEAVVDKVVKAALEGSIEMTALAGDSLGQKVQLEGPPNPKVRPGMSLALAGFSTSSRPDASTALRETDPFVASLDVTSLRYTSTGTKDLVRQASKVSPELSAAVTSYIRTAITAGYTGVAYNRDKTFNREATSALAQVMTSFDILSDYTIGFDDAPSTRSLSETLAKQLMSEGALCGELVLDKMRLPDRISPIPVSQIRWYPTPDGKRKTPKQVVSGEEYDLNFPTVFYISLDQDLLTAYSDSPVQSAVAAVMFAEEFMNDIRRVVRKVLHPRMKVTIDEEKFKKTIPPEYAADPKAHAEYVNSVVTTLESKISSLQPEQALIVFDMFGIEVIDHGNTNLSNEYKVLTDLANAKLASGAKALPTVLGMASGTSNVASTEAMMFVKYVEGAIWGKLNEFYSKVLTLALRLMGYDVYVEFQYNSINLRPDDELESYRAQKQSRILDLLSIGFYSDDQACLTLTGNLTPAGHKPLSGTGFRSGTSVQESVGDGANGANGGVNSSGESNLSKNLNSSAPTGGARGSNTKKAEVIPLSSSHT